MTSIETLVRNNPTLTGAEILQIQANEKIEDEKKYQKANEAKLALIADINTNGGYYKGIFGISQLHFYRFFDLEIDKQTGTIYCSCEEIYIHKGTHRGVLPVGEISIERRTKTYQDLGNYGLQNEERVTVKEWDEVNDYINSTVKFWE